MMFNVNFLAVLVAAVVAFLFGWLWYSKALFGNIYMKLEKPVKKKNMGAWMFLGFVTMLVTSYFLAVLVSSLGNATVFEGMFVAFWILLGFATMKSLGGLIWGKKPPALVWIEIFHDLISFLIMGAILGGWA